MTLDELRSLLAQLQADPAAATDEQLAAAMDAIRAQVQEQRTTAPSADTVALLTELRDVRNAVVAEQAGRAEAAAQVAHEADELLRGFDEPEAAPDGVEIGDTPAETAPVAAVPTATSPAAGEPAAAEAPASDLQAVAASLNALAAALTPRVVGQRPDTETRPAGRPAGRIGQHAATGTPAPSREAVTMRVRAAGSGGAFTHGQELRSTAELARAFSDRLRGGGQGRGADGVREFVARVDYEYPASHVLGKDFDTNHGKIEAATAPNALVAAGGLCAPLETLYDVEVIGSTARPVRDALARFQVDRGGIQYRPNSSAAAAVGGTGVWTVTDDAADPLGSKPCFIVDCPALEDEVIEAIYLCLEFSNITARFDPETTAANVQEGMIAHTRRAENQLLAKLAAGSKVLSAPKVIGASRDILVNLDKATAYYRNRHRIDTTLPLTWITPAWVKSLIRADLARQMAAGDWAEALAPADSLINGWFTRRNVTPVWHLDGPAGSAEVQTITITGTPTGGTFTLTRAGETTSAIAFDATAATVEAALEALENVDAEDITVAGGPGPGTPWTVTFGGEFAGNQPQMTATGSFTGGSAPAVAVTTTTGGGGAITVNGVSIAGQTYDNAAAGAAIPGFPDQIDSLLFTSGSWLFLDGGSLDLGLVRDSTLNERNRYRQFSETFEGAAFRGIESLRLAMTVQPTGGTAGTVDTSSIAD